MTLVRTVYDPDLPTLLLSLHPENTQAIVAQTKVIEYRHRFFKQPFQAFVYTTGSQGGVNLFMKCDQPIKATVNSLAQIGYRLQDESSKSVNAYFKAQNSGVAIPITEWVRFPLIRLKTLRIRFDNFVTPRSYVFLNQQSRQTQLDYFLQQPILKRGLTDWTAKYADLADLI